MIESVYITSKIHDASMFIRANLPWARISETEFVGPNERIRIVNSINGIRGRRLGKAYVDYYRYGQLRDSERHDIERFMFNRDITFTDINELVETYENSKINE